MKEKTAINRKFAKMSLRPTPPSNPTYRWKKHKRQNEMRKIKAVSHENRTQQGWEKSDQSKGFTSKQQKSRKKLIFKIRNTKYLEKINILNPIIMAYVLTQVIHQVSGFIYKL